MSDTVLSIKSGRPGGCGLEFDRGDREGRGKFNNDAVRPQEYKNDVLKEKEPSRRRASFIRIKELLTSLHKKTVISNSLNKNRWAGFAFPGKHRKQIC